MEFLSDENEMAAQYVLLFVREAVHKLPHLKETILHSLQVSKKIMIIALISLRYHVHCVFCCFYIIFFWRQ